MVRRSLVLLLAAGAWRAPGINANGSECKESHCELEEVQLVQVRQISKVANGTDMDKMEKALELAEKMDKVRMAKQLGDLTKLRPPGTCKKDTGRTCNLGGCWLWQGATECIDTNGGLPLGNQCFCPPGYCSDEQGLCSLEAEKVTAEVVPISAEKPTFPASQANLNIGMCFSGGGIRAQTMALGGLRALEEMKLMSNVDVISSVSGGSWASGIYMFAPNATAEILGGPTVPEQLTMELLKQEPPAGIKTTATDQAPILKHAVLAGSPLSDLIQVVVCEQFLGPFGMCEMWAFMAKDQAAVERIKKENPLLASVKFQIQRSDRPRSLVMNGIVLAERGYETKPTNFYSIQMSPDYIGSPFYPDAHGNDGYLTYSGLKGMPPTTVLAGGGLLASHAFGGPANSSNQDGGLNSVVGAPDHPFSVAQAMGISSFMPGPSLANDFPYLPADPMYNLWPVTDPTHQPIGGARINQFADGGDMENSGLLALLQRRVKKVVWFAASYQLVNRSYNLCELDPRTNALIHAKVIDQVLDKFGFGPELAQPQSGVQYNQVFEREALHDVVCQLQQHFDAGTPPVISFSPKVLPNSWWGIEGGWTVDILLVYLENSRNFNDALPPDTQAELARGASGPFPNFPAYATAGGGGSYEAYNLLGSLSEYYIKQNSELFQSFLR